MNTKHEIIICLGSSCFARGNRDSLKFVEGYIKEKKIADRVDFRGKLCSGNCGKGPILFIDKQMHENVNCDQLEPMLNNLFFSEK